MIIFIVIMVIIVLLMIAAAIHSYYGGKEKDNPLLNGDSLADNTRMIQFNELQGKKPLQQFLSDYPSFTRQSLEAEMKSITESLVNLKEDERISSTILQLLQYDRKRERLSQMQLQRTNLINYKDQMVFAIAIYADKKEEYTLSMRYKIQENHLYLFACDITLGSKTNLVSK